jgi:hypothetical protein
LKSIKPGRGPSGLGFIGSIFAAIFGVFWTIMAFSMTRGIGGVFGLLFPLFGVLFVGMGIAQAVFHYKNATGKNRYSMYDITDDREESDPAQNWVKGVEQWDEPKEMAKDEGTRYCPWCREPLTSYPDDIVYCRKCGREL